MARVAYTDNDVDLVARMMGGEAEGAGELGLLIVGHVIVNRLVADSPDFIDLRSISDVIFQIQGGNYSFEAAQKGNVFYNRARGVEKKLAKRTLDSWRQHPASYALWYFNPYGPCPPTWYNQPFTGQFKLHCFYEPLAGTCDSVYMG